MNYRAYLELTYEGECCEKQIWSCFYAVIEDDGTSLNKFSKLVFLQMR